MKFRASPKLKGIYKCRNLLLERILSYRERDWLRGIKFR
jgi:hypothetical protein